MANTSAAVSVDDVVVSFDGFVVLDHLTFAMGDGELRFLVGPNGASKTTLMDLLSARTRPLSRSVILLVAEGGEVRAIDWGGNRSTVSCDTDWHGSSIAAAGPSRHRL